MAIRVLLPKIRVRVGSHEKSDFKILYYRRLSDHLQLSLITSIYAFLIFFAETVQNRIFGYYIVLCGPYIAYSGNFLSNSAIFVKVLQSRIFCYNTAPRKA